MTQDTYEQAILDTRRLLHDLLHDPDHGTLGFRGKNDLKDLIVLTPGDLEDLVSGAVLAIDGEEWMALASDFHEPRQWQHYGGRRLVSSEELYIIALEHEENLRYCHSGY